MLSLKNIKKSYKTYDFTQVALDDVSINFRKKEFVSILGPSGSGKTTCLNIIGGLDRYDSGDLIINGKSTKKFKDSNWDSYRNNSIGFVFQSYNLISHITVLENVEIGMTLSGKKKKHIREKALSLLKKVGLEKHAYKRPNQLSGGQMQRVAIARALANDPDIVMMDEPTGALDSKTSLQIMELIKEICSEKLVIMVTHNPELANTYSDRIITFADGKVISDTNPYDKEAEDINYVIKKTKMSFFSALKLSGRNIATKKWRTTLTAFASSIGIIGIALILSLSNGFNIEIEKFQKDSLTSLPILISQNSMNIDKEAMENMRDEAPSMVGKEFVDSKEIYLYDPLEKNKIHTNIFTDDYLDYVNNIDTNLCNSVGYIRFTGMNLITKDNEGKVISASLKNDSITSMSNSLSSYPESLDGSKTSYLQKNYDMLSGKYPESIYEIVLIVDNKNRINYNLLQNIGFDVKDLDTISFEDVISKELQIVSNNDFYIKSPLGNFVPNQNLESLYDNENNIKLKIVGVARIKQTVSIGLVGPGIVYSDKLLETIIDKEKDSEIVKLQKESDVNVLSFEKFKTKEDKNKFLTYLGADYIPFSIMLYPTTFENKDMLLNYLDEYNFNKEEKDVIVYTDLAETISSMTSSIMDAITLVLIAFASISLVVSLIMIGIITYISVLERTKEIGILRAIGARKKDITNVFNAETFIIGMFSGTLGLIIAFLLTIPTNIIIEKSSGLENVAKLNPIHAIILLAISVILTLIGGYIPAKMAAKKDPVIALRSE